MRVHVLANGNPWFCAGIIGKERKRNEGETGRDKSRRSNPERVLKFQEARRGTPGGKERSEETLGKKGETDVLADWQEPVPGSRNLRQMA